MAIESCGACGSQKGHLPTCQHFERITFVRSEAAVSRRFMDRHANEDFSLLPGAVTYAREYRCDCGFRTSDSGVIFDHTQACTFEAAK